MYIICTEIGDNKPYFSLFPVGGGEAKIHLGTMDSIPCQSQESRRFKSDWTSKQIEHMTFHYWKHCNCDSQAILASATTPVRSLNQLRQTIWYMHG